MARASLHLALHDRGCPILLAQQSLSRHRTGKRIVLVSRHAGQITGTVQLDYDTPANQPHRAEIRKLLVHPEHRRHGIAKMLMADIETIAARLGRNLITLDTRTGDMAEPLYAALGYRRAGIIPGYCLDTSASRFDSTTVMYKSL